MYRTKIRIPSANVSNVSSIQRLGSGSGGGVNVDLKVCSHPVTHRKLFRLHIGNCFITCRLLIEITFGRASKLESSGDFLNHLVTIALLIELYPVVPFPSIVTLKILRPTFGSDVPPRDPDQSQHGCKIAPDG